MFINYITDTCSSDYKDMDGAILQMIDNIDKTCDGDLLCDEDKSVKVILYKEEEDSAAILGGNQYELIICGDI